jgi:hypothetical protein
LEKTDAHAAQAGPQRLKVIYIMGAARSGSSILGVVLGNCAGTFFAGELFGYLENSGRGVGEREQSYWAALRERLPAVPEVLRDGRTASAFYKSVALFKPSLRRIRTGPLRLTFREHEATFLRALARDAGAEVLIDSSSYPLRAKELTDVDGLDIRLIYVLRDPRSVVASFTGSEWKFYNSKRRTNAYLAMTASVAMGIFLSHPRERRLLVRYEDLVREPEAAVRRVLEMAGMDCAVPDLDALAPGSPFGANKLVFRANQTVSEGGPIAFRRSTSRPPRDVFTQILQAPFMAAARLLRPQT